VKRVLHKGIHYFHFLKQKRFWKWAGIIAVAVVLLQLVFPYDRAFLFARLDGVSVGLKNTTQLRETIQTRYKDARVETAVPRLSTPFKEAGIVVDPQMTANDVARYPVWQRLLPFSFVYKMLIRDHNSRANYQMLSLNQWADQLAKACTIPAKDAGVEVKNGTLQVVPSTTGAKCKSATIIAQVKATQLSPRMQVSTGRQTIQPERTDADVKAQLSKIQVVLEQGVKVQVLGSTTMANTDEIVSWLQFKDGDNHKLTLDVDPAKVQSFINRVQQPVYIAPGVTTVYVNDGQETRRAAGVPGQGIDANDLIAQLRAQFQSLKTAPITARVTALQPKQEFVRIYTNTSQGLQALLNTLAAEKGNMAIAITELDGRGRSLSANGNKQYHPASTYKLFIAYSVVKRIETGQLKWEDTINGVNVNECLTRMIVNSDNACAEAFAEKFSWKSVQSELKALGMTGTDLNRTEPVGTVTDQALFLQKLYRDQLMKPEHKEKLLALMKRQVYRAGIPSGVKAEVADKVGFLGGLLHDSGLVYTTHGVYALSIYSYGGSWGGIADASRQIEALLAS